MAQKGDRKVIEWKVQTEDVDRKLFKASLSIKSKVKNIFFDFIEYVLIGKKILYQVWSWFFFLFFMIKKSSRNLYISENLKKYNNKNGEDKTKRSRPGSMKTTI